MSMQNGFGAPATGRLPRHAEGRFRRACVLARTAALAGLALLALTPATAQEAKPRPLMSHAGLQSLQLAIPEAELHFDSRGDIPDRSTLKYLSPDRARGVDLETNLGREPRIQRLMWQVSRNPFYGPVDAPVGLVASGYTSQRAFAIRLDALTLSSAPQQAGAQQRATVRRALDAAATPGARQTADVQRLHTSTAQAPKLDPAAARIAARAQVRWTPPAPHFYVRVVPVAANANRVIGKPSAALELLIAEAPLPDTDMSSFEVASQQEWDLRLVSLRFQPAVNIERWPSGCKDIPRDNGKDFVDVVSDLPAAAVDLVNWASKAYADLKQMAVSLVGTLLPFVPESMIKLALDSALAAAGVPPSIPNIDQLMNSGADYLATQMAAQIPVPASGMLAEMAYDEAKDEIRQRTKQALLDTAKELARKQRDDSPWCRRYYAEPFFEATVRNAGSKPALNATVRLANSGTLLDNTLAYIDYMAPGQTFTIPLAFRQNKNVKVRWVSQMPDEDRRQALNQWWDAYWHTPVSFSLYASESLTCLVNGSCSGQDRKLASTPKRIWEDGPAWQSGG